MANPFFNRSDVFGNGAAGSAVQERPAKHPGWGAPAPTQSTPTSAPDNTFRYGAPAPAAEPVSAAPSYGDGPSLEQMYASASATTADTKRLTYDDVILKTAGMLAILVVAAAASWQLTTQAPMLWVGGMVVGLILGLINSFKKKPSPLLITLYSVAQGVFLGGISYFYQTFYDGVVLQAVLATIATFAAALLLFKSGKVRVTPKFTRWLLIAITGYAAFSFVNLILVWTGVLGGWGMRGGGIGVLVGLFAVGLAAASLIVDFDSIKRGVERGAPARFAWAAAFGLLVTLIWLYLEFLRLLAILTRR